MLPHLYDRCWICTRSAYRSANLSAWCTYDAAKHRYLDNVIVFANSAVHGPLVDDQTRSALDHYDKRFGRHAGVGVQHAKPVTTRLPKLGLGDELARLVGLRR